MNLINQGLFLLLFVVLYTSCEKNPSVSNSNIPEKISEGSIKKEIILKKEISKNKIPDYDTLQWTDILLLDSTIIVDMKYATTDNFVKTKLYNCNRCFLRPKVAKAVVKAHHILKEKGLGLKMLDCFRPRPIQQKLWDKVPNASYVTPPTKGSMHNRGCAVDLTIVDNKGKELDMGTDFDYFGKEAHHTFTNHSDTILANRIFLKKTMYHVGLKHIRTEWWHYSFYNCGAELSDMIWKCE